MSSFVPIPNYENYKININGEIIELLENNKCRFRNSFILTKSKSIAVKCKDKENKYQTLLIHRLLAECFIPNPNNYTRVLHIDGNTLNNDIKNLQWVKGQRGQYYSLDEEEKKDFIYILGFNNEYLINEKGIVLKHDKKINKYILKEVFIKRSYYAVELPKTNKGKTYYIHRLLAQYFIPNPNNYKSVEHRDKNPLNNKLENLKWSYHNWNGINKAQPVFIYDVDNKFIAEYKSIKECSRKTGLTVDIIKYRMKNKKLTAIPKLRGFYLLYKIKL